MPRYSERKVLPYDVKKLFAVVADVEKYPEFLPWVLEAQVFNRTDHNFMADLTVGYKFFKETYRSEVILTPYEKIDVRYVHGPFKHLANTWEFTTNSNNQVTVDFLIDFDFNSSLFQTMMEAVFSESVKKMMTAFEQRVQAIE